MKLLYLSLFVLFVSCNNDNKETEIKDGPVNGADSNIISKKETQPDSIIVAESLLAKKINNILQAKEENSRWHVLNDKEAKWISGQFDYFITPKRKENPDYPYIAAGDFDGDNRQDLAAVVTDSTQIIYQLVIISDADSSKKINYWKEDILEDAAISTAPMGRIEGTVNEKIKKIELKSEAIHVEYFEKASFIIYWNGKSYNRIQQGD